MSNREPDVALLAFIESYRIAVTRRPLMYAGLDLSVIEAMWHIFWNFEDFARDGTNVFQPDENTPVGKRPEDDAYSIIAQKYKCGSWTLGTKVEQEMCEDGRVTREASEELIKRLREVDSLREELRSQAEYHRT